MNYWRRMHEPDDNQRQSYIFVLYTGSRQLGGVRNWSPDQNQLLWQEQLASEIILRGEMKYYYTFKNWLMAMLFRLVLPMNSWRMPPMSKNTTQVSSSFAFDSMPCVSGIFGVAQLHAQAALDILGKRHLSYAQA